MKKTSTDRPNLLFVFADQMRGMDMRCAGNPDMITPTFDRIAREGLFCSHGIATIPICGPNRACLLTGAYGTKNGVMTNDQPLPVSNPTLGTLTRDAGYRTGYIGKWHLDGRPRTKFTPPGPRRAGFDDFWAVHNCTHEYLSPMYYRDTDQLIVEPGYEPEIQTRMACEFLDGAKSDDRPFCLVLSWGPPHNPYECVPDKYRYMYDPDRLRLRQNSKMIPREHLDPAWTHRASTADYYALITSLDDLMGRLLDKLDMLGIADNTIVVFTSDHGDMLWSQGLLYKSVPFEESISVPLIMRWPKGIAKGSKNDTPIGTVDMLPTLCGMMGIAKPDTCQGIDLSANLMGRPGAATQDAALIGYYNKYQFRPDMPVTPWRGLRTRRYTYSERADRKAWHLFDNELDPYQLTNLATDPKHADLRKQLAKQLASRLKAIDDPFAA
jgi:arylsulfatase A-like enzyme